MTPDARAFLDLSAGDLAAVARDLAAEAPLHAVSRAYYAVFHAAVAALDSVGLAAKSHAGVHALFGEHFVQSERVGRELGRTLNRLMRLRQGADYHIGQVITMDEARDAETRAAAFVAAVEALLVT